MPESQYSDRPGWRLRLPRFEGRLSDLLRLLVEKRLDSRDIRASDVACQMSEHIGARAHTDLEEIGDLAVELARLLVIKSTQLLARPIALEGSEEAFTDAPAIDRTELVRAALGLRGLEGLESYPPTVRPVSIEPRLEARNASILERAWVRLQQRATAGVAPVAVPAFVRLEVALSSLLRRLAGSTVVSLRGILSGADRKNVVIYFLAVLELTRRRQLVPSQDEQFGDITLKHADRTPDVASRAG